jgi:poly(3-hydroxybutyrate) depolymerase
MTIRTERRYGFLTVFVLCLVSTTSFSAGLQSAVSTIDETLPPGNNYDKAEFRLWLPAGVPTVRAAIVLVPGSNGDGRPMADDADWQSFASKHQLALVGVRFTDKPHEQSFIEHYVNVSQGSGQALLSAFETFAERSKHPELSTVPFLLWGMSAGGEFNYEFVAWKPERVLAFVVNKGGIYYTALASQAARSVPGILFIGGRDLDSRVHIITGIFDLNRRAGALWALAEEPGAAHVVGRSLDVAKVLYEDVLSLRLDSTTVKSIAPKSGFIADLKNKTFRPADGAPAATEDTAWLPTERVARAWQAMVTDKPFERE